ncbi:MAG: AraC family transcriptional regulator [Alkalispirochaeta sp.]
MAYRPVTRIELEMAFSQFLLELHGVSLRPRHLEAVERVRKLEREIGDRAHEPWSLDRAAAATNLSRRRFSELWRQCTGHSFVTSLQAERVARAQSLMKEQALSVVAAAYAVGFNDVANFYRVFRRTTGYAPGAWLAMGQKG